MTNKNETGYLGLKKVSLGGPQDYADRVDEENQFIANEEKIDIWAQSVDEKIKNLVATATAAVLEATRGNISGALDDLQILSADFKKFQLLDKSNVSTLTLDLKGEQDGDGSDFSFPAFNSDVTILRVTLNISRGGGDGATLQVFAGSEPVSERFDVSLSGLFEDSIPMSISQRLVPVGESVVVQSSSQYIVGSVTIFYHMINS